MAQRGELHIQIRQGPEFERVVLALAESRVKIPVSIRGNERSAAAKGLAKAKSHIHSLRVKRPSAHRMRAKIARGLTIIPNAGQPGLRVVSVMPISEAMIPRGFWMGMAHPVYGRSETWQRGKADWFVAPIGRGGPALRHDHVETLEHEARRIASKGGH